MKVKGQNSKFKNGGFTLIEIMVSISIFAVVMIIVIGALLVLNDANKKAQSLRAIVDNLNFAMDDMTRNIRTGQDFVCNGLNISGKTVSGQGAPCRQENASNGVTTLAFTGMQLGKDGGAMRVCYVYHFDEPSSGTKLGSISYGSYTPKNKTEECYQYFDRVGLTTLVSPEVEVRGMKFYVFNEQSVGTNQQPIVIIALSGDINVAKYKFKTPFNIQTTVSQRGNVF